MKSTNYFIAYIAILNIPCMGYEHMGERLGKSMAKGLEESSQTISQAGIEMAQIVSSATTESAQKIGVDAAEKASTALLEATKITAETSKDRSKEIAEGVVKSSEIIGSAIQQLVPLAYIGITILGIKEVVNFGRVLYKDMYPDAEKITKIKKAEEEIASIDAKRSFRECLIKNSNEARNNDGIPQKCEECGEIFAMTVGRGAFQEMVETFKEVY